MVEVQVLLSPVQRVLGHSIPTLKVFPWIGGGPEPIDNLPRVDCHLGLRGTGKKDLRENYQSHVSERPQASMSAR